MAAVQRVAVVGAGLAGMCLASTLSTAQRGWSIDVFERDPRERDQGTSLDIKGSAQEALKSAGVFDRYWEYSREGSDVFKVFDVNKDEPAFVMWQPQFLDRFNPPAPESNRQMLREAFIDNVHSDPRVSIRFQCAVDRAEERDGGERVAIFGQDGDELGEYDLVVDSSGVSSKFRRYRVQDHGADYYTGCTMIHGIIPNPDETCDPFMVNHMLGEGSALVFGPPRSATAFCLQRFGASAEDKRTSFYYMSFKEKRTDLANEIGVPPHVEALDGSDELEMIRTWVHNDMGDKWQQRYHTAVDAMNHAWIRPLMQHPHDVTLLDSHARIVCMGDALHALPPWSGEGGNVALCDAHELSKLLLASDTIDVAELRALEKEWLKRARPIAIQAEQTKVQMRDSVSGAVKSMSGGNIMMSMFIRGMTWLWRISRSGKQ